MAVAALGFRVEIVVEDARLADAARLVLADLPAAARPEHRIAVLLEANGLHTIVADGRIGAKDLITSEVLDMLCWFVNQGALHHGGDLLLFHAAAVCYADDGVLIPAPSGSGKSTLAAALVDSDAGCSYLSDEIGALDPASMRLVAYPKALSLDAASLDLLGLRPRLPAEIAHVSPTRGPLGAGAIRRGAVAASCSPRLVLFPERARTRTSEIRPLRRSEVMQRLVANSFNLVERPEVLFEACAELCRQVDGYHLAVGDPSSACSLVRGLVTSDRMPVPAARAARI